MSNMQIYIWREKKQHKINTNAISKVATHIAGAIIALGHRNFIKVGKSQMQSFSSFEHS